MMDTHDYDAQEVRDAYRASIIAGTIALGSLVIFAVSMLAVCAWAGSELLKAVHP